MLEKVAQDTVLGLTMLEKVGLAYLLGVLANWAGLMIYVVGRLVAVSVQDGTPARVAFRCALEPLVVAFWAIPVFYSTWWPFSWLTGLRGPKRLMAIFRKSCWTVRIFGKR